MFTKLVRNIYIGISLRNEAVRSRSVKLVTVQGPFKFQRAFSSDYKTPDEDEPKFDMENPFEREQLQCILCKHKITADYKNVRLLSQFQSPYTGRIYGRHITGLCKKQQEIVEKEIVKAQVAGLMPGYIKDPNFLRDPELFDVERPLRPHRF